MTFVEREYALSDYWTIFRQRRNLILLSTATAALSALLLSLLLSKTFKATATLFIPEPRIADARMPDFIYYDLLRSYETSADNDYLIQKTIENFGLQNPPYQLSVDEFKRQRFLQVELLKSTRLVKVSVEFPSARLAADIANFFAGNIISLSEEVEAKDTQEMRLLIKKQMDLAGQELESSRQSLMEFNKNSKLEELRETVRNLLEQKSKNEADLSRLDIELLRNSSKREWLRGQLKGQSPESGLNHSPDLDAAHPEVRNGSGSDKPKFAPNPSTKEDANDLLHQEIRRQLLEADSEILGINAEKQMLQKNLKSNQQKLVVQLQEKIAKENTFDRLSLQSKLASDIYASFNKKYQEVALNLSATTPLKLIAPALPSDRPSKPRIALNVLLGGCLGFLASTLLVFLSQSLEVAKSRSRQETLDHKDERLREIKRSGL